MGRAPCCAKIGLHKGQWTPREDTLLIKYIQSHGEGNWRSLPKKAGLLRCGKSCRLRWINYLKPGVKRGNITSDEEDLIIRLHSLLGNRWSLIAGRLPGRTDNEIKNYWNTYVHKRHRKYPTPEQEQEQESSLKKKKNKPPPPPTKPKVYLPKAVRVRNTALMAAPKKDSFDLFGDSNDLFCGLEGGGELGFFSNGLDINNMLGDGDMNALFTDHVDASDEQTRVFGDYGLDFECQFGSLGPEEEDQNMYEQYLQLLNNDNQDGDQAQLY